MQHRRHAAGAMEFLAEVFAGRHAVHQQRDLVANAVPVADVEFDADVARNRIDVRRAVGRAADRGRQHDGVLERLARHNLRRAQVFVHHIDDAAAGLVGHLRALAVRRGNGCAAGQRHAESFGEAVHRQRGTHAVAMADRRCGAGDHFQEFVVVDAAGGHFGARMPDHGAGTGALALEPAVEHGSAGKHDGRQVDRGRAHQHRRGGLVAAGGQHHAVKRIAVQHFDQPEVGQVAVERGGGPLGGFLDGMNREFDRYAAGVANAFLHAHRKLEVVAVARRQVTAGLRYADDGLAAVAQFFERQAVIHAAFQIERGHAGIVLIVEPGARAQPGLGIRHRCPLRMPCSVGLRGILGQAQAGDLLDS